MDRKSVIIIAACIAVMLLWNLVLSPKLFPPKPLPPEATNTPPTRLATSNAPAAGTVTPQAAENPAPTVHRTTLNTNVPEELIELTNSNAHYTFTSRGGGLKEIELLRFRETVSTRFEKVTSTNQVATLNDKARVPTLALLDGEAVEGDGVFKLTRVGDAVRAEKTLSNGLVIIKDFRLSTNYLVETTVRLENQSKQALNLPGQEWIVGTATPMGARDNGQAVGVLWYNGAKLQEAGAAYFSPRGLACMPRVPPKDYRGAGNVVWVAAHNQFFALVGMPRAPSASMVVRPVELPRPTGEEARMVSANAPAPQGYETALIYPALTLAPSQSWTNQVDLYAGPKEYQTLVRIGGRFNNNLDLLMNFGVFGFVSKALLLGMNWLHEAIKISYGWAIIAITIIIKLVFWPLTQASTRSMKRMQALQPQMKEIQQKYKDDPVKMNRKTMEFMKEHKVSPLGGCLPMLLQIPVFFGFYRMIQSAIELRGESFLWVADLSKPDTLFYVPGTYFPFNLLPLIMGVTMLWQARLTPPSPGMDPTQAKIMRYMPLMFMVFLYNFSAGLTLYWTVQNLLTIAQTKLTKTVPEPAALAKGPVLTPPQKKRK